MHPEQAAVPHHVQWNHGRVRSRLIWTLNSVRKDVKNRKGARSGNRPVPTAPQKEEVVKTRNLGPLGLRRLNIVGLIVPRLRTTLRGNDWS